VVRRTHPPLPAPAEAGVRARHGGLVAPAGDLNLEVVFQDGTARVYLYDGRGEPLAPAVAKGRIAVVVADKGETTIALDRREDASGVHLAGAAGDLPAYFIARVEVDVGGKVEAAELRWARAGERGGWSEPPPSP
jgi:hypothetical protein